jgi:hypothetical protein
MVTWPVEKNKLSHGQVTASASYGTSVPREED